MFNPSIFRRSAAYEPNNNTGNLQTGVNSLVLLDVRQLFERLVAVGASVLAQIAVHQRVLRQLLGRRERLQALAALVSFLLHTMRLLGVTLHVRLVGKLLQHARTASVSSQSLVATILRQIHTQHWHFSHTMRNTQ